MPSLASLLLELAELGVDPKHLRLPSPLFDTLMSDAEDVADELEDEAQE